MARTIDTVELIPSPRRLIRSLRDLGYDFAQAVADIVDNSIEAKATQIDIKVEFEGDDSWVRISDNGNGMAMHQLKEAMRYGADRDYDEDDLGKFGLGLKTASLSQCRRLTVASRWNRDRADISACSWDISHIETSNKWEVLLLKGPDLIPDIREPLEEHVGTVVFWQRLDRILGYESPYGDAARRRLSAMCRDIEIHLGMVFHRFLMGEAGGKKVRMSLNGNPIKAWDPFCRAEKKTKELAQIKAKVEYEGISGAVVFQPYILPHQDDFGSPDAFRLASGPVNWNQQQGFYIYRANRMIQSGGWCGLRAPDEHTKLARIAVMFSPSLDDAFKINVAKMRVQLPSQIRDYVRDSTAPMVKMAREIYDRKPRPGRTTSSQVPAPPSRQSQAPGKPNKLLSLQDWARLTLKEASKIERPAVKAVLDRMLTRIRP